MLGVAALLGGCMLMHGRGRLVAPSLLLMHGAVLLVAHGGVVRRTPARLDGAFSGELGPLLGCLCPLLGGQRVLFMAVHGATSRREASFPHTPAATRALALAGQYGAQGDRF